MSGHSSQDLNVDKAKGQERLQILTECSYLCFFYKLDDEIKQKVAITLVHLVLYFIYTVSEFQTCLHYYFSQF